MKLIVALIGLLALSGCVSQRAELKNDRGQVVQCANEGWGWLGAPVAAARQAECLKKAQAAGYRQVGDPQLASGATDGAPILNSAEKAPNLAVAKPPETIQAIQAVPAPTASIEAVSVQPPVSQAPMTQSPADRLKKLEEVYKSGLISDDEYERKRQEILSTL